MFQIVCVTREEVNAKKRQIDWGHKTKYILDLLVHMQLFFNSTAYDTKCIVDIKC